MDSFGQGNPAAAWPPGCPGILHGMDVKELPGSQGDPSHMVRSTEYILLIYLFSSSRQARSSNRRWKRSMCPEHYSVSWSAKQHDARPVSGILCEIVPEEAYITIQKAIYLVPSLKRINGCAMVDSSRRLGGNIACYALVRR